MISNNFSANLYVFKNIIGNLFSKDLIWIIKEKIVKIKKFCYNLICNKNITLWYKIENIKNKLKVYDYDDIMIWYYDMIWYDMIRYDKIKRWWNKWRRACSYFLNFLFMHILLIFSINIIYIVFIIHLVCIVLFYIDNNIFEKILKFQIVL